MNTNETSRNALTDERTVDWFEYDQYGQETHWKHRLAHLFCLAYQCRCQPGLALLERAKMGNTPSNPGRLL